MTSLVSAGAVTASAQSSFLFGKSANEAFGPANDSRSPRYRAQAIGLLKQGFHPLTTTLGLSTPSELRILIKDDSIASSITQDYVDALSNEKSYLMRLYGLSDEDYNRLAAIAFGILGRETKFGTSLKYKIKESNQDRIRLFKSARAQLKSLVRDDAVSPPANSRGLTQIKEIPGTIEHYYCANEDMLNDPKVTAVATVGFLAESLKVLKNRVRNKNLQYITNENLFDYVLYVYFGSMKQLTNPRIAYRFDFNEGAATENPYLKAVVDFFTGRKVNREPPPTEIATPEHNLYIQTVHRYMRALAFFENQAAGLRMRTESACRIPGDI